MYMYVARARSCRTARRWTWTLDLATGEREPRHVSEKSCRGLSIGLSIVEFVVSLVSLRSHSDLLILTQPKTPTQPACWLDLCLLLSVASQKVLYLVHPLTKDMSRNIETSARAIACIRGDAPRARLQRILAKIAPRAPPRCPRSSEPFVP